MSSYLSNGSATGSSHNVDLHNQKGNAFVLQTVVHVRDLEEQSFAMHCKTVSTYRCHQYRFEDEGKMRGIRVRTKSDVVCFDG